MLAIIFIFDEFNDGANHIIQIHGCAFWYHCRRKAKKYWRPVYFDNAVSDSDIIVWFISFLLLVFNWFTDILLKFQIFYNGLLFFVECIMCWFLIDLMLSEERNPIVQIRDNLSFDMSSFRFVDLIHQINDISYPKPRYEIRIWILLTKLQTLNRLKFEERFFILDTVFSWRLFTRSSTLNRRLTLIQNRNRLNLIKSLNLHTLTCSLHLNTIFAFFILTLLLLFIRHNRRNLHQIRGGLSIRRSSFCLFLFWIAHHFTKCLFCFLLFLLLFYVLFIFSSRINFFYDKCRVIY